jgi:hypothetical protein
MIEAIIMDDSRAFVKDRPRKCPGRFEAAGALHLQIRIPPLRNLAGELAGRLLKLWRADGSPTGGESLDSAQTDRGVFAGAASFASGLSPVS